MRSLAAFIRACHPGPTVAVTLVITAFGWSVGWRLPGILLLLVTVLIGQLSVGWSNDAFDAHLDAVSGRAGKPTVVAHVTARRLWIGAIVALASSVALSWLVAGLIGGSLHVFALAMAWLYNLRLSRTSWSWLPYALAFGAVPGFVSYGLDGQPPSWWATACFAIIGVSAHLANALPDLELDVAAGRGGSAVRLGRRRSVLVCWTLLAAGTAILAVVAASSHWWISGGLVGGFLAAVAFGTRSPMRSGMFVGIMVAVVVDVVAVVAVT
ncbi:MAG: hypothetical protein F2892_06045 [Actinobacteria bacterium]|uniref:Unannotated protein n=1 Tax=freshwater metagenome TaxID=449393 RepID=A0A6J7QJQ2_9ZZZZ|nr:hypothetical protein [Actinomycetota bacterium]